MFYTSNLFSLKLIQTALFNCKSARDFPNLNPGSMCVVYIEGLQLRWSTFGKGNSPFFSGALGLFNFWGVGFYVSSAGAERNNAGKHRRCNVCHHHYSVD